jgi:DNA-binding IclR family transcriptional regulator
MRTVAGLVEYQTAICFRGNEVRRREMPTRKTPSAPSLERGLSVMELLANSRNGLPLADLARQLALPKSSVHCLLLTLERRGYLHRNERTNRYLFGLRLFSLANMALSGLEVRERAAPFLHKLAEKTRLTVHLAIPEQNEAVLLDKVEPLGAIRLATWLGKRMDVHCTALGKALIAHLPQEELDRLIRERGLPRHNDNSIVSPKKLKEELERVRKLGYSTDNEEDEVGMRCIGAPVFDDVGSVVAAVSISGTTSQVTDENSSALVEQVCNTAVAVSRVLGFNPNEAARIAVSDCPA